MLIHVLSSQNEPTNISSSYQTAINNLRILESFEKGSNKYWLIRLNKG